MSDPNKINEVLLAVAEFNSTQSETSGALLRELVAEWTKVEHKTPSGFRWVREIVNNIQTLRLLNEKDVVVGTVNCSSSLANYTVGFPGVRGIWKFSTLEEAEEFAEKRAVVHT